MILIVRFSAPGLDPATPAPGPVRLQGLDNGVFLVPGGAASYPFPHSRALPVPRTRCPSQVSGSTAGNISRPASAPTPTWGDGGIPRIRETSDRAPP